MGFATIGLSTSIHSSQALQQRGQGLTVSLLFLSSPNTDESFGIGVLAAYVDLHKAFDSINWDAIWRIFGLRAVSPKLINLIPEQYSGTESDVRCGVSISNLFIFVIGVCQGVYWFPHFAALVWTGLFGGC